MMLVLYCKYVSRKSPHNETNDMLTDIKVTGFYYFLTSPLKWTMDCCIKAPFITIYELA